MSRRALFIINPAAGAGRAQARWQAFGRRLESGGVPNTQVVTDGAGDAFRLAQEAAHRFDVLVAVGGDGTASEVAGGLIASGASHAGLAIIPFGTGNDAATALGIQTEAQAHRALAAGRFQAMDMIKIECQVDGRTAVRHALLFAGIGIVAETLKHTTPTVKWLFGKRFAYPAGLLRALWDFRSPLMRVVCAGQTFAGRFLFVGASNTEHAGGGLKLAPGARADDGLLNINLVEAVSRWEALRQLRRLTQGRHTAHPQVRYLMAPDLTVDADPPLQVAADGELLGLTPARFVVQPNALQVLVG